MIEDFPAEWWLYLRLSDGYAAIERQRATTTAMIERRGGRVTRTFSDADRTAFRNTHHDIDAELPPRPDFDSMLAELPAHPGVGIAAWHADRLSRDPDEAGVIIRACRRDGGHLIATKAGGDYDVTTQNGRSHLRTDIQKANDEVDHNVERMLEAKTEAASQGRWLGGKRPFGWRPSGEAGVLALDQAEARLIERGTADVLAGVTLSAIARDWRASGVPCSLGGKWDVRRVRSVLLRARNAGLVEHLGQVFAVDGGPKWAPVVEADDWRAVRAILTDPARHTGPGPEPRHLLTGIALCGGCGAPVTVGRSSSGKVRYFCSRKLRGMEPKPGPHATRGAAECDAYITALAVGRLKRDDAAALLRADRRDERATLILERDGLDARKAEQWRLYKADVLDELEMAEGRRQIRKELADVQARLDALTEADVLGAFLADPERAWEAAAVPRRRAVVSALVHVTILPVGPGRTADGYFSPDGVDVHWARQLPSDG